MSDGENITLFELVRRLLICGHELTQEIFPIDDFLTGFLSLLQFFERHSCDQRLGRVHTRQILCDRVSPESKVPLWDLPNDTIVPLYIINSLNRAFKIAATLQEPKFS